MALQFVFPFSISEKAPMHLINILTFKCSIFVKKNQLLFVFENDKIKRLVLS